MLRDLEADRQKVKSDYEYFQVVQFNKFDEIVEQVLHNRFKEYDYIRN